MCSGERRWMLSMIIKGGTRFKVKQHMSNNSAYETIKKPCFYFGDSITVRHNHRMLCNMMYNIHENNNILICLTCIE